MSNTESHGTLDISLHALVVVSIADHFTRSRIRSSAERVFGMLLGTQEGRKVEIFTSFETCVGDDGLLDLPYLESRKEAAKTVHPNYEIMGWYATGKAICDQDRAMYKQIIPFNESPLFLLLDTNPDASAREIPLFIYESEYKVVNDQPELSFTKSLYKIETTDSERLAVDHVARSSGSSQSGSQLQSHLDSMYRAIKMLRIRVGIIIEYLKETGSLKIPANLAILRRISSLCNMLPAIDGPDFKQEFLDEYNDALLLTYMASIMKASSTVNELIDKFNLTYDKQGRRRGVY